ncbi:MAG: prolipoprotein diacylglyceryl transferase [Clostridia bacterium]|nr:prolipoprotein diacylglyceryl transferase [Clostridia bacterium]
MNLYEEAEKISILGLNVYRFGFFVMLGMLGAAAVIGFLSWARRCRKGTGPLLLLMSILLGGLCSRAVFCLLNQELGAMMPLASWFRFTGGGWSMMGLVGGVMLAGFLTGKLTGQKPGLTLDLAACALPLFIALERAGEGSIPEFDYSRRLTTGLLEGTFLSFSDYDGSYLATWKLAAILMLIIFLVLVWDMTRSRRDGDTCLLFLMLFGGCSILLESLRYDRFLSISFVGLQQIFAGVLLAVGVLVPAFQAGRRSKKLALWALVSVAVMVILAILLEFALDRTTINKLLIYALYLLVVAVPVTLGIILRQRPDRAK